MKKNIMKDGETPREQKLENSNSEEVRGFHGLVESNMVDKILEREWYEDTENISELSYYLVNVKKFSLIALLAFLEKTWKWKNEFKEMLEYYGEDEDD